MYKSLCIPPKDSPAGEPFGCDTICQDIRVNAQVGTRSPYSLPFVILPVPARSPFRFIRHWRRSAPNPGRGAFWCALQLKHSHGRPPMTAPTTLHINFWDNQGDASRPHNFTISHAHPPSGGFHIAQAIFHCASAQFHPFARTDFTARVSPLIFRIRRFQR